MNLVEELRATGLARLPVRLTRAEVADVGAWFSRRPAYLDAHVPQTARNRGHGPSGEVPPECECWCAETADAIMAPHLFEFGLSCTDLAARFLARDPPVAYSMNAFWTRPGPTPPRRDIQEFHVDADDERFLALFFCLSDVLDDADGPFEVEGPDGAVRRVAGPAGTAFLADTRLPHRGPKPTRGVRGVAWYRWGVSDRPPANVWDSIEPVPIEAFGARYPVDPRLRESVRLLVR